MECLGNSLFNLMCNMDDQDKKLMVQTYNTLEDFILGPCIPNIEYLLGYQKLIQFCNKFIRIDFSQLSKKDSLIKIFVFTIRLISLLVLNYDKTIPMTLFDLNEVAEKLVEIHKGFIVKNIILFQKDYKCNESCENCDYYSCSNGRLEKLSQEMYDIGFLSFQILKKMNYEHMALLNEVKDS